MKKFGILCLALVIALGALGVGYAAWTDTIFISGTVNTGSLCFSVSDGSWGEVGGCPDKLWGTWVENDYPGGVSCPPGYHFEGIHVLPPPEDKCVADVSFLPHDTDGDGNWDTLDVIIDNAYPYFLADISFYVCNCGTIPLKIQTPIISQDPSLLIQYGNHIGYQLHPGQCDAEISFMVGVTQHLNNDPQQALTPQGVPLTFTIDLTAIQWNEY